LYCGEDSSTRRQNLQEKKEDSQRRSEEMGGAENKILGGSDPTLCGLSAAQPAQPSGVATAQVVQQVFSLRRRQSCNRVNKQN
jgi:hypothetical protein